MNVQGIIAELDHEIERLQAARAVLTNDKLGRPTTKRRRKLTPEGRARIAAAVKRRWAAHKAKKK